MRVVAGCYRGRSLIAPPGCATRPILDRVKVGVFDWLGSKLARPGSLPPLSVLDLFCGGGSLGIECLSRGAAHCTFVDSSRQAVSVLRRNLDALAISQCSVLQGPVEALDIPPPPDGAFELVFLDPPYRLNAALGPDAVMGRLLGRLTADIPTSSKALAVWRHDHNQSLPSALPGGWTATEQKRWGTVAVSLFERRPAGEA